MPNILIFILLCTVWPGTKINGQTPVSEDSCRWVIELPVWIPGFRGAVSYGEVTIDGGNESGNDGGGILGKIFDSKYGLDYYLVGKVRYSVDKWQFQADIFGGQIEHSTLFSYNGSVLSDTKISVLIPRVLASYRVLDFDLKKENAGTLHAYVYTGLRVFAAGVSSTLPDPMPPMDITTNWTEFLVGGSFSYLWRNFTFTFKADTAPINLFSTPSWWYQCHARYRIGKRISAELGWVRQDFLRVSEIMNRDLKLDFSLQGPLAGVAIHF